MKILLRISMFMLAAIVLASCSNKKEFVMIEELTGEATIKGVVLVDSDQRSGMDPNQAAENAIVRFIYMSHDLSYTTPSGPNYAVTILDTTNRFGEFQVTVPTTNRGVSFTIEADQFRTRLLSDDNLPLNVYFGKTSSAANVKIGEERFVRLHYGSIPEIVLD